MVKVVNFPALGALADGAMLARLAREAARDLDRDPLATAELLLRCAAALERAAALRPQRDRADPLERAARLVEQQETAWPEDHDRFLRLAAAIRSLAAGAGEG